MEKYLWVGGVLLWKEKWGKKKKKKGESCHTGSIPKEKFLQSRYYYCFQSQRHGGTDWPKRYSWIIFTVEFGWN